MNAKLIKYITAYFTLGSVQFLSASEAQVLVGSKVTINVAVSEGTAPFTYQWKKNGGDIAGATGDTLVLPFVTPGDAARYSVVVTNKAGFTRSDDAAITIVVAPARAVTSVTTVTPAPNPVVP